MRRVASGLALAVVAAVALAAVVDASRKALEPEPARAEPRPRAIEGLTLLSGSLVWLDDRCRLHRTALSTLQRVERPRRVRCGARLLPSGKIGRDGPSPRGARGPSGDRFARATRAGVVLTKDGREIRLPLTGIRALAWSPDARWLAAAGRDRVYLVRVLNRDLRIRSVPLRATQLVWLR